MNIVLFKHFYTFFNIIYFQRLIPVDSGQDLFVYKSPDVPSPKIYTIRPMDPSGTDRPRIYAFCRAAISSDSSLDTFPGKIF